MNQWINLHALWQILVAGLICGAGLPTIFMLGLRALSLPGGRAVIEDSDRLVGGSRVGMALAGLCFAFVAAGIAWGIYFIVAGA